MISDHGPFNDHNVGLIRAFMEIDARCVNTDHSYNVFAETVILAW